MVRHGDESKGLNLGRKESEERIRDLESKVSAKEQEVNDYLNLLQRTQADFQNYMKQSVKERQKLVESACDGLILELIEVEGNIEAALKSMPTADENKSTVGLQGVLRQIQKVLDDRGVRRIGSVGLPFDHGMHDAVGVVKAVDKQEDTIVEEVQSGFMIRGRLLRPAKVVVSKKEVEENG